MNLRNVLFLFLFAGVIISCNDDDVDDDFTVSVFEIVESRSNLSILEEAIEAANLDETLHDGGTFTLFAPTNDAFVALLDSNDDWNSLDDIPSTVLSSVLTHHVLSGEVRSTDLADGYVNTLATGPNSEPLSLLVQVTDSILFNGNAEPINVDIDGNNGVVHIVDAVMVPPTVVNLAINGGFNSLVAALTDSRHTTDFVALLSGDGPFTVFAPTDAAFSALLTALDVNSISEIPIETLEAVLLHHVVSGANVQSDQLTDGQMVTMAGGEMITINLTGGPSITSAGNSGNVAIAATDVQGSNGVVHVVNSVLLP